MQLAQGFHKPRLRVAFATRVFPAANGGRTGCDAGGEFIHGQVQLPPQFFDVRPSGAEGLGFEVKKGVNKKLSSLFLAFLSPRPQEAWIAWIFGQMKGDSAHGVPARGAVAQEVLDAAILGHGSLAPRGQTGPCVSSMSMRRYSPPDMGGAFST